MKLLLLALSFYAFLAGGLHPKWFGARDTRDDPGSFLTREESDYYSGVGRVECLATRIRIDKKTNRGAIDHATGLPETEDITRGVTGFHVGSFTLLATNAHAFEVDYLNVHARRIEKRMVEPEKCWVAFYHPGSGQLIEKVAIAGARIRWNEPGILGDRSNDIALVKLVREGNAATTTLPYEVDQADQMDGTNVTIVGFHSDLQRSTIVRKGTGTIYRAAPNFFGARAAAEEGLPYKNRRGVFVGDYPSNHGASGSPILNSNREVIGIHQGQADHEIKGVSLRQFNHDHNYNIGIFLDKKFHQDVEEMK